MWLAFICDSFVVHFTAKLHPHPKLAVQSEAFWVLLEVLQLITYFTGGLAENNRSKSK